MGQPVHNDFRSDLAYSDACSDESFWDAVYHKAFPDMVSQMRADGDVPTQRMGIDRVILLSSGRTLFIDEKKRREDYDDVLLEYVSRDTDSAPGWIEKDLAIDYLAYAFMPKQRVYLFNWCMLRRAWRHYGQDWKRQYQKVIAPNKHYRTISVAVPILELRKRVESASVIQL